MEDALYSAMKNYQRLSYMRCNIETIVAEAREGTEADVTSSLPVAEVCTHWQLPMLKRHSPRSMQSSSLNELSHFVRTKSLQR